MKRIAFIVAVLFLQGLQVSGQDSLQFVMNEKTEIDNTLREIVQHANQAKENGRKTPADEIEMDIMRLNTLLENVDAALKNLACDTAVPPRPDAQPALNALRGLILQSGDEQRRKEITELKERIVFVKKVHDISVTLWKMKIISAMTESIIRLVPGGIGMDITTIMDDVGNFSQPGDVGKWTWKTDYKKYLKENEYEMEARILEKAWDMRRINDKGENTIKSSELKRIVNELVMQKTTEDVKYFEERIIKIEKDLSQGEAEDKKNTYFAGLVSKLEQVLGRSIWINLPGTFAKNKASINVVVADDATGSAIPQAKATLDPLSGIAKVLTGGIRFEGVSAGSYVAVGEANGYAVGKQSVNITECMQYNVVIRLQTQSAPTPPAPKPPVLQNTPPDETPEDDDRFDPEIEPSVVEQFKAWLTCGGSLELVPGEIDQSCGVAVSGWRGNTSDRVEVIFPQRMESGSLPGQIVVFPDNTSQDPSNMFTAGVTDYHHQYEFPFQFSARSTAPSGSNQISIVVRQKGSDDVRLTLTVNVLSKGQISVPGAGNPPPAVRGSGGKYCVWRHKLFSDVDPNCWHFVASTCDNSRYGNPNNGYILAGSTMSQAEADALITQQSAFFSDACKNTPVSSGDSGGRTENLSAQLQSAKDLYGRCQYQEAINVMNAIIQTASSNSVDASIGGAVITEARDYIGRSQQAMAGIARIETILQEADSARNSCKLPAGLAALEQINAVNPPSKECKVQYVSRANALRNQLNDLQSEIDWSQLTIAEAENHLSSCRFKEAAEAADSVLTTGAQCGESSKNKGNEIKAKAETMMQIEDDIDTERTLAEMAVAKNLKDKKAVVQKSMQNIRNLIAQSGNSPCFQKYLEVVKIFDNALSPNALDNLHLDDYGSGNASENNTDGWGAATKDAANREPEVIDETPQETVTAVAETDGSDQNKTKWQNTLTNVIENITEAVIQSQIPAYPSDPNSNNPPDTNRDNNVNQNSDAEGPFVGKWQATFTLISHYGPRDADGNEVCEFEGNTSDSRQLTIFHNNYGYGLYNEQGNGQRYYARSNQNGMAQHANLHVIWMTTHDVRRNSIRFADTHSFAGETITTTIELEVNGNRLDGTMKIGTASGCDYNFSIGADRQ